jgi:electron transfer flavoprotein alpha subunit
MTDTPAGVLVYCPLEQGALTAMAKELLGKGANLAACLSEDLYAVVLNPGTAVIAVAAEAGSLGVRQLLYTDDLELEWYTAQRYTDAMEGIVRTLNPSILLIGATIQGRDLAARLAARLNTGLTADCTDLQISPENRLLLQTRPAYGGNVIATIVCARRSPQMATVRPGVFDLPQGKAGTASAGLRIFPLPVSTVSAVARVLSAEALAPDANILTKAEVVVACGRGVKNRTGLSLVEDLARVLGGVVGGSRGVVEDGLVPRHYQVGQTGRTIKPKLYIACGISGAVQHIVGIRQAACIIAINHDPEAPIFKEADFCICADLFEALPKLTKMVVNHISTNQDGREQ